MSGRRLSTLSLLLVLVLAVVTGCGEKIAIPEPTGLFSVAPYLLDATYPEPDALQVLTLQSNLFVLTGDSLTKRNQKYELIAGVGGFGSPTSLCADDTDSLVFVWDQDLARVTWYRATDLAIPDGGPTYTVLPAVRRCVAMAACAAGIEQVPGASTFLYLADPDSGVVHRYAYEPFTGLIPYGILCSDAGVGARFVLDVAGLARDAEDSLLVCDRDTLRNWVIRFDSVPDLTDIDPDGEDPLRGHAALFDFATCVPPAAADYVLGNAAECEENDWVGGVSDAEGEFARPVAVTLDGSGRIFVSDQGNDRIQIFSDDGYFEVFFGNSEQSPAPGSLGTVDVRVGSGADAVYYGAYVFVVTAGEVRKFISGEYYRELNTNLPPPEQ